LNITIDGSDPRVRGAILKGDTDAIAVSPSLYELRLHDDRVRALSPPANYQLASCRERPVAITARTQARAIEHFQSAMSNRPVG
jgi:hypothetical protein